MLSSGEIIFRSEPSFEYDLTGEDCPANPLLAPPNLGFSMSSKNRFMGTQNGFASLHASQVSREMMPVSTNHASPSLFEKSCHSPAIFTNSGYLDSYS